ncbi:MAG TPA: PDZ domain-containing protein [Fimbriimonadales bacterium]|nr:PDZ domain-containing protein [Fimbriimonadales bacterium]
MLLLPLAIFAAAQTDGPFHPGPNPMLMQHPTMNDSRIVFQFAGDLWSVSREGGEASRLTSSPGIEANPYFSPDGSTIAFSGQYDGNIDVYTIPATGGSPKRLTYHPAPDGAVGWTPDGKSVVFASGMLSNTDAPRLFKVGAMGGVPEALPFPMGTMASFSPDGQKIAYVPGFKWELAWKRYRGGQAYQIWIGQMSDSKVYEIPRKDWNDEQPMWIGNKIYYLSDPKGPVGLYSYDTNSRKVSEEIPGNGFDIKSATAGPGGIVYEKLGSINLYDLSTKKSTRIPIDVHGDFPEVRPEIKSVQNYLSGANVSPTGQRAVVAARGWIFTVPAEKGDSHLLDETQGVFRRDPAWSPDAKTIAYITDQNGKQQLALYDVQTEKINCLDLGNSPAYYYGPSWSPDSKKVAYTDNRNELWCIDLASGKNTMVDEATYTDPAVSMACHWSSDSNWVTWARDLDSHMQAIFVYDLAAGKKTQITDGLSDAKSPIFDRDGKHLYFFASTNAGPALSWLDLSSMTNPNVTSSVYCAVLRKDLPNPLEPQSDEEPIKDDKPGGDPGKKPEAAKFNIDLDGIESSIISLPMPAAAYAFLEPGPAGSFFAMSGGPGGGGIVKFSMADRRSTPFAQGGGLIPTADGTKVLLLQGPNMRIVSAMAPPPPGGGLDLSDLKVKIDPKVEWRSIFNEIWRNEPMLFYAANLHGIDAEQMRKRYAPFLANIASRDDLNYLFTDMLGEIAIGHMWAQGGDIPGIDGVPGGLLGADYAFENGRYKITRIYDGERWNPGLRAPLAQPGINAKAGEYILAIDGKELTDSNDIYETLEGKADRQVKVKIGPSPSGVGAREVVVVPVANEFALRQRAWAEDNRRKVAQMTGGRAGYVHVPDTGGGGWTAFLRYYYAQTDKDGIVVDERFNHGGLINDFMVYEMSKDLDAAFTPRTGKDWPTPGSTIYGPKVMIANQFAGSGGDMFPWLFKHKKVGPVVGKRTWGGLVAAFGFPTVDGGQINSPNCAFYNPASGKWEVEGHGVDPDIDVELDPYLWRQGKDAQLERAIAEMNRLLQGYKRPKLQRPPNPDKSKVGGGY